MTIISLFNNAANGSHQPTAAYSSALMVALDTSSSVMTATVLKRWDRPDHGLSHIRGNAQILPNGDAFVCWSANAYLTEFASGGQCILEAKLKARGFATYRAFKANFTGFPEDEPALEAFAFGTSGHNVTTVAYVSWNGATEVVAWNFYVSTDPSAKFSFVGTSLKLGFETIFGFTGYGPWVIAEAIDVHGKRLRRSSIKRTIIPVPWPSGNGNEMSKSR